MNYVPLKGHKSSVASNAMDELLEREFSSERWDEILVLEIKEWMDESK